MWGESGKTRQGALVAIALLVVALVVVMFLWMRDRELQDAELEIDIGAVPVLAEPTPHA